MRAVALFALVAAAAVSCAITAPDVTLDTTSPGETGGASSSSSRASTHASSSSSQHASSATTHASVGPGGGGIGGQPGSSGGGGQGGVLGGGGQGGSGGACCDCDGDGHDSIACGGDDCADHDSRAFPGQTMFFVTPIVGARSPGTDPYDFNCDGHETFHSSDLVDCSSSGPACDATVKWVGPVPDCGQTGQQAHCHTNALTCTMVADGMAVQSCN